MSEALVWTNEVPLAVSIVASTGLLTWRFWGWAAVKHPAIEWWIVDLGTWLLKVLPRWLVRLIVQTGGRR